MSAKELQDTLTRAENLLKTAKDNLDVAKDSGSKGDVKAAEKLVKQARDHWAKAMVCLGLVLKQPGDKVPGGIMPRPDQKCSYCGAPAKVACSCRCGAAYCFACKRAGRVG